MWYHPLACFSFFDGPAASKSGPLIHGQVKDIWKNVKLFWKKSAKKKFDSKSSVCDKTTKIFREIIFNTVRWQRQLNAKGFFQTVLQNFYSIFFTKNKILIEIRRKIFDNKSTNRYLWENCKRILNQDLQTFLQISDFLFPYLNS